jgi:hypothetical protein
VQVDVPRSPLLVVGVVAGVLLFAVLAGALALVGKSASAACGSDVLGPGGGQRVGATTFGGPADPSTPGAVGAFGPLTGRLAFAELSPGGSGADGALGHLPPHTKLRITANGRSVIAEKLDVGRGGGPVGQPAAPRVIDLWWETARALGLPAAWSGLVKIEPASAKDAASVDCASAGIVAGNSSLASILSAADALDALHLPYNYGSGHVTPARPTGGQDGPFLGLDCSSTVSWVLQHAGFKLPTMTSTGFMNWGAPGPGKVTIYANPTHVWMDIGGRAFGTSGFARPNGGPGWFTIQPRAGYRAQFVVRHVPGF